MKYVIIGNGVAGINACLAIRERDTEAQLTVVSRETPYFYSRTALMYIGMGVMRLQDTEPLEREEYAEKEIHLIQDFAKKIDPSAKKVKLESGSELEYDKLLLATGAGPATYGWPGMELEGVCYLVSFPDVQNLIEKVQNAKRGVIVGGGLIGIELAEVFSAYGLQIDYLIKDDHYWARVLSEQEGRWVEKLMEDHGITVHHSKQLASITGSNGRVESITTEKGDSIPCDLVALATGVRPETELAKAAGIPCNRGILTNNRMETQIPSIYAAGDCIELETSGEEPNSIQSIWYVSRDMGEVAGANMAGENREYSPGYWYNSAKFFDKEYTSAGKFGPLEEGEKDYCYQDSRHSVRIIYSGSGDHVLGFSFIGSRWDHTRLIQFLREKSSLSHFLEHYREALFESEFTPVFSIGEIGV